MDGLQSYSWHNQWVILIPTVPSRNTSTPNPLSTTRQEEHGQGAGITSLTHIRSELGNEWINSFTPRYAFMTTRIKQFHLHTQMTLAITFELLPTTSGVFKIYSSPLDALMIYTAPTSVECKELNVRAVHRGRD